MMHHKPRIITHLMRLYILGGQELPEPPGLSQSGHCPSFDGPTQLMSAETTGLALGQLTSSTPAFSLKLNSQSYFKNIY